MTSRSDPYALPYPQASSGGYSWRRGAFAFLLTLAAIVVFGISFAMGYQRVHESRVLPGVTVSGVSLAGLSRPQAEAELRAALPSISTGQLIVNIDGQQAAVAYASFGRDYDLDYLLDTALDLGRGANFVEQLQQQLHMLLNGINVEPAATWNSTALADKVAQLAMAAQRDPVSASLTRVDGHYVVSPAATGQSVDVEGAVADAMAAVNNASPADTSISVRTSVVPPAISTEQAQAAADLAERVTATSLSINGAELTTEITPDVLRGWVHLDETPTGDWQLVIPREPVRQFVSNFAQQTDIAPTNATFAFKGGDVQVVSSSDGRATDVEATTDNVMTALQARVDGGAAPGEATLALVSVPPTFKTADAQAISSQVTKIGEWTTHFTPSSLNGQGVNISIPASIINGYVVEPGQVFDFLAVIGPITSPPYTAGAAIVHGRTVLDGVLGGGMCSCSTTLFNAAMRAGLDIKARRNHAYYISRYPVGLDATVWIASEHSKQTMSFLNDLKYPVLIRGINAPGVVTFQLYGVPDGRTVELSDPVIENQEHADEYYVYTDALAPGQKHLIEFQVDGFDSTVVRTVRDASGVIIHKDTFKSHYKTITGLVQVGRYEGDPPAGKRVLAAVWRATHGRGGSTTP